jgi:uncharacterized iron-regulated membrane protein
MDGISVETQALRLQQYQHESQALRLYKQKKIKINPKKLITNHQLLITKTMFKKITHQLHRYVGLVVGLFALLFCLTGSIYVFEEEITKSLNPEFYAIEAKGPAKPLSALIAGLQAEQPGQVTGVSISQFANEAYKISLKAPKKEGKDGENKESNKDGQKFDEQGAKKEGKEIKSEGKDAKDGGKDMKKGKKERPKVYFVNQYTGQVLGQKDKASGAKFFEVVLKLHRFLLLDKDLGSPITATACILFTLGCLSGIIIWIPRKLKYLKQNLSIKFSGNKKRLNYDLHRSLGFYSFLFLMVFCITGLCFSFHGFKDFMQVTLTGQAPEKHEMPKEGDKKEGEKSDKKAEKSEDKTLAKDEKSAGQADKKEGKPKGPSPEQWQTMLSLAQQKYPQMSYKIDQREGKTKAQILNKSTCAVLKVAELNVEAKTAQIKTEKVFANLPLGEQIMASIYEIHTGMLLGLCHKILALIFCLMGISLPITGLIIWMGRGQKKAQKTV